MKKIILMTCALIWGCGVLWAQKFEKANNEGVKIKYQVISATDRTVQVTGGSRPDVLIIPGTVEYNGVEYRVTVIKEKAYMPATKFVHRIRRLVLPEGLVEIGKRAFYCAFHSNGNESIYIPSTVRVIGKDAFARQSPLGAPFGMNRTCVLEFLPNMVDVANCETYGLSKESVTNYWISHSPQNDLTQSTISKEQTIQPQVINNQVPPQQSIPTIEQPKAPSSDVDVNIPQRAVGNENTVAVIFANENYQEEVKVEYALNDGEIFKTYCNKVLGLPEDNIHIRKDATLNNIKAEMTWLKEVAKAYNGDIRFIIYYAGHGISDEKTGIPYLLPVDGKGSMSETGYSLKDFYCQLGEMPSEGVVVFLDACFCGSLRGEGMLHAARGIARASKAESPKGNVVVFSATQGDETAYPLKEKEHGLFTYYLLKKLKETNGNVPLGELGQYVTEQVSRKSIIVNGKSQTPAIMSSETIGDNWKNLKLF